MPPDANLIEKMSMSLKSSFKASRFAKARQQKQVLDSVTPEVDHRRSGHAPDEETS